MYPCNNPNHQPDGHLVKITADECNVNYEEIIRLHKATYKFFNPTFKEYIIRNSELERKALCRVVGLYRNRSEKCGHY
jgi:hypothetical protein